MLRFERRVMRPFVPFIQASARYNGLEGGRGSGKSHFVADQIVHDSLANRGLLTACVREVQNTIAESAKRLIENKLSEWGLGEANGFKVFKDVIQTPGDGLMIFRGMQSYNADSIKSLEGYKRMWWEEAHRASAHSLKILRPTFREPGTRMFFTWNAEDPPDKEHPYDTVDGIFGGHLRDSQTERAKWIAELPGGGLHAFVNYDSNPWFPDDLEQERLWDLAHRPPEDYAHIWGGSYALRSEARVFRNWRVENFDTPANAAFLFGSDFGFAMDPTVLLRMWLARFEDGIFKPDMNGRFLMIDREAYRVGCDTDHTPALFAGNEGAAFVNRAQPALANPYGDEGIDGALTHRIIADSANPQMISYMQRHGFQRMEAAVKGPGSVEEGVNFLKSYTIIIHPNCKHSIREFTLYSFKVDKKTGLILPELADEENHVIDSARYAVEPIRKPRGFFT